MVLYRNRAFSEARGKYCVISVGRVLLQSFQSGGRCCFLHGDRRCGENTSSLSAVFTPDGALDCPFIDNRDSYGAGGSYEASFTIEAVLVLAVVFFTFGTLIEQAYRLHDFTSGTMILEEMLEKTRRSWWEEKPEDLFTKEGEEKGRSGIFLGEYELQLKSRGSRVDGVMMAGNRESRIEMKEFRPEVFLRRYEALWAMGDGSNEDGSGVQKRNEPKLYDFTAAGEGEREVYAADAGRKSNRGPAGVPGKEKGRRSPVLLRYYLKAAFDSNIGIQKYYRNGNQKADF